MDGGGVAGSVLTSLGETTLINVTFSRNYTHSLGAIYVGPNSHTRVINGIDENYYESTVGEGILEYSNSIVEFSGGSGHSWNPDVGIDLGGNLDIDPKFVYAPDNFDDIGDYHLRQSSPAINAGDSSAVPPGLLTDLDGNPRIMGAAVDMGAYEFQGPGPDEWFALDFNPNTVNLSSSGKKVSVTLTALADFAVSDIDDSSLLLNGSIPAMPKSVHIDDSVSPSTLTAKFLRSALQETLEIGMNVPVQLTGVLDDGTFFRATDIIRVIDPTQSRSATAGANYAAGSTATVDWLAAKGDAGTKYDGYISMDDGNTWTALFKGLTGQNSYSWVLDAKATGKAQVLVEGRTPFGVYHAMTRRFEITGPTATVNSTTRAKKPSISAAPNPFNPTTTISFSVPASGHVELLIFDLAGRRVKTLVSGSVDAGSHTASWHGRDDKGRQVASGVYLYQLRAGDFVETKRMVLVK